MEILNSSITNFTEQLASPAAVPGGGGASALTAAIGIALGDMVGELTIGKKKYADVEDEIKALMSRAQALRIKLLACIEEDARAFEPLSKAYGILRGTRSWNNACATRPQARWRSLISAVRPLNFLRNLVIKAADLSFLTRLQGPCSATARCTARLSM